MYVTFNICFVQDQGVRNIEHLSSVFVQHQYGCTDD